MTYAADIKDYERLLAAVSYKVLRRMLAQGVHMDLDDLMQESRFTFMIACEKFDPEFGVKFSTYLWKAVQNNLLAIAKRERTREYRTRSIDAEIGEDGGTMHDILADDAEPVEDRLERLERMSDNFSALGHNTKLVVMALDSPPIELVREIRRMEKFRALCVEQGYAAAARVLDVHTVCVLLGLGRKETRHVKRELKEIMERVYG